MIPRIIHQIWLGPLTPPTDAINSWKEMHPNWDYRLWTEENLPKLKNQEAYDKSGDYPQKSDILRYELLQEFGGVYMDADEICLKAIDPLIESWEQEGYDLVVGKEGSPDRPELLANGFIAVTPNHLFIKSLVDEINVDRKGRAWELTGPKYLTELVNKYGPKVRIISSKVFFPIHHRDKDNRNISLSELEKDPDVYGVQLWSGTKRAYKPLWYKQPFAYLLYAVRKKLNKTFQIAE